MRKKEHKNIVRAIDAQSEVLGFVIIMCVMLSATTLYLSAQVPEWTRDYEFEHESNVMQDFAELSATIDRATLSGDPTSSSTLSVDMASERVALVGIHATGGTLRFQPEQETFECIACVPNATYVAGGSSWNNTPANFSAYDSLHVEIFPEGAKLQLEIEEDRIYDSGGNESLSGEFRFNNFTVTNGTTLSTYLLAIHATNITIGPNSSIIADGGGLFGGKYEEDGKGEGGGHTPDVIDPNNEYSAGGGGAGHSGAGGHGGKSHYSAGGQGGSSYGTATNITTADFGSGGGGGDCGRTISGVGRYVGGKGGEGGGSIALDAPVITIFGTVSANGEDGRPGSNASDSAGGGGGGGSGGTILLKGGTISILGNLTAQGGDGGIGGNAWDVYSIPENNGGGGGGGSGGRIKIFYGINLSAPGGLLTHLNASGGAGGEDGDGGDGELDEEPGSPGAEGSIHTASITYTESIPHYAAGYLISDMTGVPSQGHVGFDIGTEMVRQLNITWNATTPSGTDVFLKIRSSFDANMSDALPWEDCPEAINGQDISDLPSVSDGHRYIQWRADLLTWDRSRTPILQSVNMSYEYGIPTLMNVSGNIEFDSKYLYLPNSNLIYEHGAVIKNQTAGEFMLFSPPIALSQDGTGKTALKISAVNLTGDESSVGGSFSSSINAYYQSSALLKGGLNFRNITLAITTQHPTAWTKWFNETCEEAGLQYGTDPGEYYINGTGTTMHVIFHGNNSKPINLWLERSKVGIEVLK